MDWLQNLINGGGGVPSLDGLQMGGGMGNPAQIGQSTQGMTMGQGFQLPESKPFDYAGLLSIGKSMQADAQAQQQQPVPMASMGMPQAHQYSALQPIYQGVQYEQQPTAGRLNSLLGGAYGPV